MCGRFGLTRPDRLRLERLGVELGTVPGPRFNIAPGQDVLTLREKGGARRLDSLRWGLHQTWGDRHGILPNVRSEGGFTRGPFRAAVHVRRCLVFADVFYEWQDVPGRRGRQPWALGLPGGGPFALGGIWEGGEVDSVAILTTAPNGVVLSLHDRMPVIIEPARYADWLDHRSAEPAYREMIQPWPSDQLVAWPISDRVNSVAHDDEGVLAPVDPPPPPEALELF